MVFVIHHLMVLFQAKAPSRLGALKLLVRVPEVLQHSDYSVSATLFLPTNIAPIGATKSISETIRRIGEEPVASP